MVTRERLGYTVVYTGEAETCATVNGKPHTFPKQVVVLFRPHETVQMEEPSGALNWAVSAETVEAFFAYLGDAGLSLQAHLARSLQFPMRALSFSECAHIEKSFSRLCSAETEMDKKRMERLFVCDIFSCFLAPDEPMDSALEEDIPLWLSKLCKRMELQENFVEGSPRMVELSGKTREHLARSMQKYKKMTVSEFINDLRLSFVANMLLTKNTSIVDLCYESGFTSLDYFGKQFKKKYGMTPSKFRTEMQKNRKSEATEEGKTS